jgi:hypothetical protein
MQAILALPGPLLLAAIMAFCLFGVVLALLFMRLVSHHAKRRPGQSPLPAFVGVVATAWALSLGFAASDVWTLGARADQATANERSAISRLLGSFDASALNETGAYNAVIDYAEAVKEVEWGALANRAADPRVDKAIQQIRVAIIRLARQGIADPIVAKTVQDFDELQDARNDRLAIGQSAVDESKWYLVLSLTLLTMAALAIVHADLPRAGRNALLIFALTAGVSMWILAINTNPYEGHDYLAVHISAAAG